MTTETIDKRRLFRGYLAVAVIPAAFFIVLGAISFALSFSYTARALETTNQASLEETKRAIETILRESDAIGLGMSTDPTFYNQASKVLASPLLTIEDARLRASLLNTLKSAVNVHPYLKSIYVHIPNREGLIATTSDDVVPLAMLPDKSWMEIGEAHKAGLMHYMEARIVEPYPGLALRFRYLTLFRNILSSTGFTYKGFLAMNIDLDYLGAIIASFREPGSGMVMLMDAAGAVLASAGNDDDIRSESSYVAFETALTEFPFTLRGLIPKVYYYRLPWTLGIISLISAVLAMSLGLAAAYVLSRRSFRNIASIIDIIQAAERGDPLPSPQVAGNSGYHYLIYSVLHSFMEQRYLKLQLSERDLKAKTLELVALQNQMNPHFLFNTLTGISCRALALTEGPNSVTEMIDHLAQILLYTLGSPDQPITVQDELIYANHYVAIQKNRYKDAFSVEWRVEDRIRTAQATRLLLQPLIENAMEHGIRGGDRKGKIIVDVRSIDEDVQISVIDDGIGFRADRLTEIRNRFGTGEYPDDHIGLYNTFRRLRLLFGDAATITIESEEGRGAGVTFRFPFLEVPVR